MSSTADRPVAMAAPEWLAGEMPPGYQTRLLEIRRLSEDLKAMDWFGQLLWRVGDSLTDAVRDAFGALGFEVDRAPAASSSVTVKLPDRRRLLFHVAATSDPVQKKSAELARVFQMVHETAEEGDRVVFVANGSPTTRPTERPEPVEPEALQLLQRLGVNVVTGPALFALWYVSLEDKDRARRLVEHLHEQDGGLFPISAGIVRA